MKVWKVSSTQPSDESLREAANALRQGNLVAFPTETVYGLGANALNENAVRRIFSAKGRPADNPLIVHIADLSALPQVTANPDDLPEPVHRAMEAFWPGPLTIILPVHPQLAPSVHPSMSTVGVRMPNHPVAQKLLRLADCPVAAPSANKSGKPSPTTAGDVLEDLSTELLNGDGVVDGGSCDVGVESTVIAFEGDKVVIYRPGGVSKEQLEDALGIPVVLDPHIEQSYTHTTPAASKAGSAESAGSSAQSKAGQAESEEFVPRSPGMKYRHYAPNAQVRVWWGDARRVKERMQDFAAKHADEQLAVITRHPWLDCPENVLCWAALGPSASEPTASAYERILSRELYRLLREFDRHHAAHILIEGVPPTGLGLAVMNRLTKASEGRVQQV